MNIWQLEINCYNISMRYLLLFIFALAPLKAFSSPAEEPPERRVSFLDSAQQYISAQTNFAANRLDSFFATERADDELGRSRIRIRSQFLLREQAKSDLNNQYRINLRLPNLEQRFKYDYYKDKKDNKREVANESRIKSNKLNRGWIFNSDIGVSVAVPPKLVTRARVRRNFETGTLIHRFYEQLTYITDRSVLVEETGLDSDYIINEDLVFRFINYKRWRIIEKEFNTNHGPTLIHRLTEDDAFNYGLTMQSIINNGVWFIDNYRLSVDYRRNLYRQWIYFDVIPGIDFPKEHSFRRTPFITFQLELLFEGI